MLGEKKKREAEYINFTSHLPADCCRGGEVAGERHFCHTPSTSHNPLGLILTSCPHGISPTATATGVAPNLHRHQRVAIFLPPSLPPSSSFSSFQRFCTLHIFLLPAILPRPRSLGCSMGSGWVNQKGRHQQDTSSINFHLECQ